MTEKISARARLETPVESRLRFDFDAEAMAQVSERIARFLGTGRYLVIQTAIVLVWIVLNVFVIAMQWDPYPFILLNLAFSTQAAYAAPLILLAQNRQDNRDRVSLEEDRLRAAQTKADTEYLARELAALRLAVGEVATRDYLRKELDELRELMESIAAAPSPNGQADKARKQARKKKQAPVGISPGAAGAESNSTEDGRFGAAGAEADS
ncbi:DUF1003 domain-containing protein [Nocardia panacis]|uniref:DUF1003 domain-containing protein n=1 Tax=Nocardia panacis TaxID=2340916 RepID=A0A3A4KR71_9NOCA|nr:DUF1003 domain-containing protein [Nocardia panacis]RJO80363.1 DUF1003 domain-containing protein [Nocardia panacis]